MAMKLEDTVPFGRSLDEYIKIFSLTDNDLKKNIIGVGVGPASFNAEITSQGGKALSIDPIYTFDADDIEQQFYAIVDDIIEQVKATPDDWVWLC